MDGESDKPSAAAAETIFIAALELPPAQRAAYLADGLAMAFMKLVRDVRQRRPLWHVCRRRWQLGTFWSTAADFLRGR